MTRTSHRPLPLGVLIFRSPPVPAPRMQLEWPPRREDGRCPSATQAEGTGWRYPRLRRRGSHTTAALHVLPPCRAAKEATPPRLPCCLPVRHVRCFSAPPLPPLGVPGFVRLPEHIVLGLFGQSGLFPSLFHCLRGPLVACRRLDFNEGTASCALDH